MKIRLYYLVLIFLIHAACYSQESVNCDNGVEVADELYNSGRYDECINYLEDLLKTCKLTKNKKSKAYELLINSNLEKDSIGGVETFFRKFLQNDPVYNIKDYVGIDEFISNYKKYYVYPVWSISIKPYYSIPFMFNQKVYSVLGNADYSKKYKVDPFVSANLGAEYRLIERLGLFMEAGYYKFKINRDLSSSYWSLNYKETISYTNLDIGLRYYFNTQKKLSYYFSLSYSNNYLLSSKSSFTQDKKVFSPFNDDSTTVSKNADVDTKIVRSQYVGMAGVGAGFFYRIKHFGFGLDLRYSVGVNQMNNPYNRFLQYQTIKDYNYVDNDIVLSKLDIGISISYLIKFKSNKLK